MAKVLSVVRTDPVNDSVCLGCNKELVYEKCKLALYSGKGKKRILETYISCSLLYCKDCDLYYITAGDLTYIRESTDYHALARTYSQYTELRKGRSKKSKKKPGHANVKNPEDYVIGKEIVQNMRTKALPVISTLLLITGRKKLHWLHWGIAPVQTLTLQ